MAAPTGPHTVGACDLAATRPHLAATIAPNGQELSKGLERLAGRLFYPATKPTGFSVPCTWIPHYAYAQGYIGYIFKLVNKTGIAISAARVALTGLAYTLGVSRVLPVHYQAPVDRSLGPLPVVIFSHGIAGTRNAYSSICIELASRGYVVMALEHSDGSASTARLPRLAPASSSSSNSASNPAPASAAAAVGASGNGPAFSAAASASYDGTADYGSEYVGYGGFGDKPEQLRKTRHRVAEVNAALQLLRRIHEGHPEGIREVPSAVASGLEGQLDLSRTAVVGHSYGGATAAAAAAMLPDLKAAICLDPWWDCFEESWPVTSRWAAPNPLLVIGSHDWNTPLAGGRLKCGGVNQERVLAAAAAGGGGALLVVPKGSSHSSFDDILLLYGKSLMAVLRYVGMRAQLEPRTAHRVNMFCIRHFLDSHLPQPVSASSGQPQKGAPAPASAEAAAAAAVPTPIRQGDLDAYREELGELGEIVRVFPGAAASGMTAAGATAAKATRSSAEAPAGVEAVPIAAAAQ
ncbi:hypothetical protein HYH03_001644 [Edaphochlamys debaryana]|uniref:1-alkyl-2-acetylglycerophosphocholine esterase n=1 Tax=Edaphochlamys debaryana TaxID=47281 RepID=A0A835YNC7_9CHLO|nr:hypothetical protein HYH03_001644 [Edaphochlamys debaryana]|eukprot:KAG2500884.1 hypothetical protein HYH03_001644 [Edaphochlamys debaryana]